MEKEQNNPQKIVTFLWFDNNAEEAVNFYTSVFRNSRITHIQRWGDVGPGPKGSVLLIDFEINGQQFAAMNGGPQYKFNPAISLMVNCENQQEVDELWEKLLEGGSEMACGWLTDKFGLSWQITPVRLLELMQHPDPATADRVMQAMMQMIKIDIATLEEAAAGENVAASE